jgi:hypothetical protein
MTDRRILAGGWTGGRFARSAALLSALLLPFVGIDPAAADRRHAVSRSPYWQVGRFDPALSEACRRFRFNQERPLRLYLGYAGEPGSGTTGVARRGWNLRDPEGMAKAGLTYHFFDDGYSDCRVYVADRPSGRR